MKKPSVVIVEHGNPAPVAPPSPDASFDIQDWLIGIGITSGECAAVAIWWPSALILAMVFCFGFAWLIERSKVSEKRLANRN